MKKRGGQDPHHRGDHQRLRARGNDNNRVDVEFTIDAKELVVFVRDYGKGFDPAGVEEPDIATKLGTKNKRGWGLKLMKSMSDDFQIESNQSGTKITIKKLLS